MALTRVSRHIIDEPLELQNINATGIGTFASLRVTGDLQVDGTTTTLDTVVTEVDKLEVAANNSTVGVAITQSGTGDILNLYDGSTEVFTVTDGGKVGVGEDNVQAHFHVAKNIADSDAINWTGSQLSVATPIAGNNTANRATIYFAPYGSDNNYAPSAISASAGTSGASTLKFFTNASGNLTGQVQNYERLRITSDGNIGIGTVTPLALYRSLSIHGPANDQGGVLDLSTKDLSSRGYVFNDSNGLFVQTATNHHIILRTNNTERLRIDSSGNVRIPDGGKFTCGASDDLEVYHNGNDSAINDKGTGNLYIQGSSNIYIRDYDTSESHIIMIKNGRVELYYDGSKKLETSSTGISVTGQVNASTMHLTDGNGIHIGNGNDLRVYHNGTHSYIDNVTNGALIIRNTSDDVDVVIESDNGSGGLANYFRADGSTGAAILYHYGNNRVETTNTGASITGNLNISGHTYLNDNRELVIGAGQDLKLYHNANHSIINNSTGDLRIESDRIELLNNASNKFYLTTTVNEEINLYYNNSKKFETTTTGAKVTGALEVTQEYPSIRPTLDLNFAATKILDRRITFTRDSVGTYIGEDGLIKYASNNTPRFDHDPTTGESLGLLIEESRTNYIDNSNDVSQWNRIINNATVESNTTDTLSPDGTNTSTKITGGTNSGISRDGILSVSTSTVYIASIFAKKGTADSFKIEFGSGGNNAQTVFNLTTKTFSSSAAQGWFASVSTSYVDYPNGWVRVIVTATTSGSASGNVNFAVYGISSGYVYFWGGQAEVGSFVTSLIPTHGSTVTRAADFATIKGTNFTDFYNQTEGTLFSEFTIKDDTYSSAAIANINQEPGASYAYSIMFVEVGTANGYFGRTYKNSSGVNISNSSSILNSLHPSTTPQKVTFGYTTVSGGELRAYWNGNNVNSSSDLSKVPTTLTNMRIGRGWSGSDVINAHIRKLSYYNKRLTNAQLQGLTQQ